MTSSGNLQNVDSIAILRFRLLSVPLIAVPYIWIWYAIYSIAVTALGGQPPWSFWLVWLFASGGVSLPIAVGFWLSCYVGDNPVFRFSDAKYTAASVVAIGCFVGFFWMAGYYAVPKKASAASATLEALFVTLGILSTIILELLALRGTSKALSAFRRELESMETSLISQKEIVKKVCGILTNRDNMTKYLCFSDAPIAFGMASLTIVVAIQEHLPVGANQHHIQAFLAGAIALQLLYSNVIFWLEAFADVRRGRDMLEHLPTWAMSIRHMLDPNRQLPSEPTVDWAKSKLAEMFSESEGCGTR